MPNKILVIDDETSGLEVILQALKKENYSILAANNGLSGYEIAQKTLPDLIIMDWEMQGLSGIESTKLLKKNPKTKAIPIIIATGKRLESDDLKMALEAGAVDYIRKPFDKVELQARVRSVLLLFDSINENILLQKKISEQKIDFLKNEINIKNKQLAERIMQIQSLNTLSGKMETGLNEVLTICDTKKARQIIQNLIISCKAESPNLIWDEFEFHFEQINKNFYTTLVQNFPDISLGEKRLCAFIKLNLTTKEIAAITYKSVDAIKKMRYRLRKKFELEFEDDLSLFLQNIGGVANNTAN